MPAPYVTDSDAASRADNGNAVDPVRITICERCAVGMSYHDRLCTTNSNRANTLAFAVGPKPRSVVPVPVPMPMPVPVPMLSVGRAAHSAKHRDAAGDHEADDE